MKTVIDWLHIEKHEEERKNLQLRRRVYGGLLVFWVIVAWVIYV